MITSATIGYRLPGEESQTVTFPVCASSEAEAFKQASMKLQLQLIERVLRLRPYAHDYKRAVA